MDGSAFDKNSFFEILGCLSILYWIGAVAVSLLLNLPQKEKKWCLSLFHEFLSLNVVLYLCKSTTEQCMLHSMKLLSPKQCMLYSMKLRSPSVVFYLYQSLKRHYMVRSMKFLLSKAVLCLYKYTKQKCKEYCCYACWCSKSLLGCTA